MLDEAVLVPWLTQLLADHLQLGRKAQDQQDLDDDSDVVVIGNRSRPTVQVSRTAK